MNKIHFSLITLTLFLLTTSITYAGIVPCGGTGQTMCRACDFVAMAQKIMEWFVLVSASIVALMFAFGGMKMVMSAGNTGAVSEGKEMMTNSVIGFLILLGAWLIINTVLMTFTNNGEGIEVWGTIQCVDNPTMQAGTVTNNGGGAVTNNGGVAANGGGGGAKLTDTAARDLLTASGITVNKTAVQGTSLEGMNTATVQDIIDLKNGCNCSIIVTGGTEGVHAAGTESHANGYKYDIGLNPQVNSYITSTYTNIGVRSDGATMYRAPDGTIYAKEGNHWDVKVPG